ncbi:MAG: Phosphopantetheine attachment site [Herbinix sp.]|jgi:acyl carrier protein|nr:Phosphopantetheine attachment site [Herbinix sp.]
MSDIAENVKSIILNNSEIGIQEIDSEDSLFRIGIDSLTLLYIINEIEVKYNICIPDDELLINNFETINKICALILKLTEEGYHG